MATLQVSVSGFVAPGFESVREAFRDNFTRRGDVGASCAAYVDGEPVVDLWGGLADPAEGRPWESSTIGLAYSVTKGAVAIMVHQLAEAGLLDLDAPVADFWPEFGAVGKSTITTRMILSHQAGLPVLDARLSRDAVLREGAVAEQLARQPLLWPVGSAFGYHALTYGWLLAEVVRRVTGESLAKVFARGIAAPLDLDFHIGLPSHEHHRVATLLRDDDNAADFSEGELLRRAITANGALPVMDPATWNDHAVREAAIPGANGITNARSIARLYAACLGEVAGHRVLTDRTVRDATVEQSSGQDRVTGLTARFASGFMLPTAGTPMFSSASFGHEGVGGAIGFADPTARIGFGYVPNLLKTVAGADPRVANLVGALQRSLTR
jgi:CubicO group peptidase (beta-lactamase class C family)